MINEKGAKHRFMPMVCFPPLREEIHVTVGRKKNPAEVVVKIKLLPSPITLYPCGIEGVNDFLSLETRSFSSAYDPAVVQL